MQTEVRRVDPLAPDPATIEQAAEVLRSGGLVAFPTETVYGLGANALDGASVARIYEAKGRASNNPLIVHVADVRAAQALAAEWTDIAARLAAAFWPGPLTLVVPRIPAVPDIVTGGGDTVGIRVPNHPVALALLRAGGLPLAAPSANRSLHVSPTRGEHVLADLDGRIRLILDGGPTTGGLESTVLNLTTKRPTLLRPGLIAPSDIENVIGPIKRRANVPVTANQPLPAPGMLSRHYAPQAELEIGTFNSWSRVLSLLQAGERVGWLTARLGDMLENMPQLRAQFPNLTVVRMPAGPQQYAARLYDELRALDATQVTRIVVDAVPDSEAWLAVRDRLNRAAASE